MADRPNDARAQYDPEEIDRLARQGGKSEWMERSASGAFDPITDDERKGLNVLGQSDPRGDGAINGVSDPNAGDVTDYPPTPATPAGGQRANPPQVDDAGTGDGGLSISGGAAGGA